MFQDDKKAPTDEQIREAIHERLARQPGLLQQISLNIRVGDGIVTLRGDVPNEIVRGEITELVQGVPEVKELRSELRVQRD
jgi:osmotically-inducible protein OsmY